MKLHWLVLTSVASLFLTLPALAGCPEGFSEDSENSSPYRGFYGTWNGSYFETREAACTWAQAEANEAMDPDVEAMGNACTNEGTNGNLFTETFPRNYGECDCSNTSAGWTCDLSYVWTSYYCCIPDSPSTFKP
jgi:hypothetical protein